MPVSLPVSAIFYNNTRAHKRDPHAGYVLMNITKEETDNETRYRFTEATNDVMQTVTFAKDWRWPTIAHFYCRVRVCTHKGPTVPIEIFTVTHHYTPSESREVFYISPCYWKFLLKKPKWERNFTVANASELKAMNPPLKEPHLSIMFSPETEVVVTKESYPSEATTNTIQHIPANPPTEPPKKKTPPRGDLKPHTAKLLLELATLKHENTCPITLDVLVAGTEDVAVMPCGHIFSRTAIEECFKNLANYNTCPACRDGGRPTMI